MNKNTGRWICISSLYGFFLCTVALLVSTAANSAIIDFDRIFSSIYDTSSSENSLDAGDGGAEVLFPGDTIDLVFDTPVTSLSVNFISTSNTPPNTYSITTIFISSSNGSTPDSVLSHTGEIFNVMFTTATPFTSAQLYGGAGGAYTHNLEY